MKTLISIAAILLIAAATAGLLVYFTLEDSTESLSATENAVVINEAMSGNKGIYLDDEGKSSDWVELYNPSDEAVNMGRFSLSDDGTELDRWTLPDITLNPHDYIVIFLSGGSKEKTEAGNLHATFKLKAKGERLILSAGGNVVDSIDLPALPDNTSYGRVGDAWRQTQAPTPGEPNDGAAAG